MLTNIIEIVILSLIQGVSEFLPISSSAHLVVVSTLYEFKSSSLIIDVSLHLGSLMAIILRSKIWWGLGPVPWGNASLCHRLS